MMRLLLSHYAVCALLATSTEAQGPVEVVPVAEPTVGSPEEVSKVEKAVAKTKERTERFGSEEQECGKSLGEKQKEAGNLNNLIERMQSDKKSCSDDANKFTGVIDDLNMKIASLDAQRAQLDDRLNQLAKQHEEAINDVRQAHEEEKAVLGDLNSARKAVEGKAKQLEKVRGETAHLEANVKDVQERTDEMDEKIRAYKAAKDAELAKAKQQLEMAKLNFTKARNDAIKWRNRSNLIYEKIKDAKRASSSWVQVASA